MNASEPDRAARPKHAKDRFSDAVYVIVAVMAFAELAALFWPDVF